MEAVHSNVRLHACEFCDYKSVTLSQMTKHVNRVHFMQLPYSCDHCDKRFHSRQGLQRHINDVHLKLKPYKCPDCDYEASNPTLLNDHWTAKHSGTKPYQCHLCDFKTGWPQALKQHVRTKHEGKPPKQKSAKQRARLDELPNGIPCRHTDCDFVAEDEFALARHSRQHHRNIRRNKLQCEFCSYTTDKMENLTIHRVKKHEGVPALQANLLEPVGVEDQ